MIVELGDVIATRTFKFGTASSRELIVLIGMPGQIADSDDFYVPYQIKGAGDEKIRFVGGIDSIQCLQLIMKVIGAELTSLNELSGHSIRWVGDDNGELGFPR